MRRIAITIAAVGIIAVGVFVWQRVHKKAEFGRLRLLEAEVAYLTALEHLLKGTPDLEASNSASIFISASTVKSILAGASGIALTLPNTGGTLFTITSAETQFSDGFPEVIIKGGLSNSRTSLKVLVAVSAILEPRLQNIDPSTLLFYIHPLYIDVAEENAAASEESRSLASKALDDLLVAYTDRLPHLTLSLAKDFSVSFPATKIAVPVPTQAGKLNGEIDIPGLSYSASLQLSGLIFLNDGIHAFVSTKDRSSITQPSILLPYQFDSKVRAYTDTSKLSAIVTEKESEAAALRTTVGKQSQSLKVAGSDFRIWTSKDLLSKVADVFNGLTPEERRVRYHTISAEGQLYRAGGGGLGCGGYAEVVNGNSANATVQIGKLMPTWVEGQGFTESADFSFAFDAQVTGHVNGPAGPHGTMVLNCIHIPWPINRDACTNLPSVTVSCDTPVGGGVGLSSYGIHGDRTERLTAAVTLHSDSSSWLTYELAVVSPDQLPITIEVGLGQLGTLGLPFNFSIPHQTLISGKAPLLFVQSGQVLEPAAKLKKNYTLSVTPTGATVGKDGYAATGKLTIAWQ